MGLRRILERTRLRGETTRHTALVVAANASRLTAQALYFVALARSIGPHNFSYFSSAFALAVILAPFIGCGSGSLIIRNCSRNPSLLPSYYGNAITLTGITFVIAIPVYCLIINSSIGESGWPIALSVLLCELGITKIQEITAQAFQSQTKIVTIAWNTIITSAFRLIAGATGLAFANENISAWLLLYISSAFIPCALITTLFLKRHGVKFSLFTREIGEGLKFSIGISSQGVYNDADKLIIPRYESAAIAGNYAAAYKVVDVAFSPIRALLTVTYPKFFVAGASGITSTLDLARRYLPATLGLGLLGSAGLYICAGLATVILGEGYAETSLVLKALCVIPTLRALHFLLADALTGANYQGVRSFIQVSIAALNIGLNFILIPRMGWLGAAITSVVCDVLLCITLYIAAVKLKKRDSARCIT
ncbi:lipopolysaccharide biosynthesis protein [Pseudoxanthomonas taiwanensis]|uniref:Polysaccharide biosynthesis protein C-terminal domain-containing protein n=1 Tax=Pseudoxanthomonas taiwanensis TaxID=176598 RepID=A0A921NX07_9GAMM|nr:oligosaccharide flippase family protein [Pseudoxanthomonas taiwanensis]KAF1688290.1 hypothetical protein CR938_10835 [Pseudoxanthomonas taiwanensis]